MKSKYKHNLFLFVPMMLLLVAVYVKHQQTVKMHVEAAAADEELLFKPLIMRTLPAAATVSIGTCNYSTSTITTTCDISVYTTTGFLCFLECSHNFITKQTNCSLTE